MEGFKQALRAAIEPAGRGRGRRKRCNFVGKSLLRLPRVFQRKTQSRFYGWSEGEASPFIGFI